MTRRLERALRDAPVPGEDQARDRAWALVRVAFAQRGAAGHRRPRHALRALAGAVAAGAMALALAITPPGEAVAMWIKHLVVPDRPGRPDARPGLRTLPAGGRLLVTSPAGAWVVAHDGAQRRLGSWNGASWSPHGLFVVAWRGDRLAALDPRGTVHWALTRRAPVHAARWSPDGVLVAYVSGTALRVVYGNGIRDRAVARRAGPAAPAWSPRSAHQLAYVGPGGRVHVVDALWGLRSWRSATGARVEQLVWSPGGRRLVALAPRTLRIFSARGRLLRTVTAHAAMRNVAVAFPRGRSGGDPVLLRRDVRTGRSEIVAFRVDAGPLRERRLFAGPGRITDVAFAPGGAWLLVGWRDADRWVFIHRHDQRVRAVSGLAAQFSPGASRARGFPRVAGWCCD